MARPGCVTPCRRFVPVRGGWKRSRRPVRSPPGIALGILLATEAGGVVTAVDGSPWTPASGSVLVAAPGVHAAMVEALGEVN